MTSRPLVRPALLALALGAALTTGTGLLPAVAAPPATAAKPTIASVQQQVQALETQGRAAQQRLAAATTAVADAERRMAALQRQLATTQARLESAKESAGELAAASYRTGGLELMALRLVLEADPATVLQQAATLDHIGQQQRTVIRRVAEVRAELAADEKALDAEKAQLARAKEQAATQREVVQQKTAAAKRLLATLEEEERRRLEAARKAAAARAAKARAAASARASRSSRGSAAPATTAAPAAVTGGCPPSGSRGAEQSLTPTTLRVMRCGLAAFPRLQTALGFGHRGNATDHDDGRAVDFMIPGYSSPAGNDLGWAVAEWAIQQPGVTYVMFDRRMFRTYAPERGWTTVGDRGSDTANHLDHVHISVGK